MSFSLPTSPPVQKPQSSTNSRQNNSQRIDVTNTMITVVMLILENLLQSQPESTLLGLILQLIWQITQIAK